MVLPEARLNDGLETGVGGRIPLISRLTIPGGRGGAWRGDSRGSFISAVPSRGGCLPDSQGEAVVVLGHLSAEGVLFSLHRPRES